jgi:hypothetical protein
MQILYNVTIKIDKNISEEWLEWMTTEHIPEVMQTGYFHSYRLMKIYNDDDEYGLGFAVQYIAPDLQNYLNYQANAANELQKKHADKYEGRYAAFRTLMEIVHQQ